MAISGQDPQGSTHRRGGESASAGRTRESSRLVATTVQFDPGPDLLAFAGARGFVWRSGSREMVAHGVAARIPLRRGSGRIVRAATAVSELLETIRVDPGAAAPAEGLPLAVGALPFDATAPGRLIVPRRILRRAEDGTAWLTTIGPADRRQNGAPAPTPRPAPALRPAPARTEVTVRPVQDRAEWAQMIALALEAIAMSRIDKVVLARELEVTAARPFGRAALLQRLAERNTGSMLYADGAFIGASPELLIRREGRVALSRPMAGTIARGSAAAEDEDRIEQLINSLKDGAEHRFVAEAVEHALATVSDEVKSAPADVILLPTLAHLVTEVTARLAEPAPSALALAGLLHPTPAVGGSPTAEALALIGSLEPFGRGRYTGPVGWVDAAGDGEWAIAIRCAELVGPSVRLLAGSGIVAGSDPDAEWAETESKFAAMLGAIEPD